MKQSMTSSNKMIQMDQKPNLNILIFVLSIVENSIKITLDLIIRKQESRSFPT